MPPINYENVKHSICLGTSSINDRRQLCVCVCACVRACVSERAIFLTLQEEFGDPELSYSRSNTEMINYIVTVTCSHIHHSDYSLYFKLC
jgi:hypothetical protein